MARKRLRCLLGIHVYVAAHPDDEQSHGPRQGVCLRCGKRQSADGPPGIIFGGGGGGSA